MSTGANATIPLPPMPPRIDEGGPYDVCVGMVADDPSGALTYAESWAAKGGGDGAAHCRALATIALGDPETAAAELDRLARESHGPVTARASIAGQATQAWLMANRPTQAFASADLALTLYGDDPDLLIAHAIAASRVGRADVAIGDLDRALTLDPGRADALALRAAAHRTMGDFPGAQADVEAALAIDPDDAAALLERGIGRQRAGDLDGAREDFEATIRLAPDGPSADLAQQNIALLDAGPDLR